MLEQRLEVDVPDPRDVLAVGDRVVERDDENGGNSGLERAHDLVCTGGILDEEKDHGLAAGGNPLEPPEGGAEPRETGADVFERRPTGQREARRGDGVVDVVEPGQGEL